MPYGLARIVGRGKSLRVVSAQARVALTKSEGSVYDGPVRLKDGTNAILYVKLSPQGVVEEIGITLGEVE